jgi:hypothetical protein
VSFWIQHPDLLLRMLLQIVVLAGLLLILARSLCRRARRESPAFAARYDRVASFFALAWSGGWRGAMAMLVSVAILASSRLLFAVPTYFPVEVESGLGDVLAEPFDDFVGWSFAFGWDSSIRVVVFLTLIPGLLVVGFIFGFAVRFASRLTHNPRLWYRVAMPVVMIVFLGATSVHRPWKPLAYQEEGAWVTHSNLYFSVRVPASWSFGTMPPRPGYAGSIMTNEHGKKILVAGAQQIDDGPQFEGRLDAPIEEHAYARHGNTHVWVLKTESCGFCLLKTSNPRLMGGVDFVDDKPPDLSEAAVDYILDSFRFIEPPAEPRP